MNPIKSQQFGMTMIEVLVSIVIISFGLLGVAAIQITGLKNATSSQYRSLAATLGDDILERMRANRRLAFNGSYNTALSSGAPAGNCASQTSINARDLCEWKQAIESKLPTGKGSVAIAGTTGIVSIQIQWNDTRGEGGLSTQTFIVSSQLCDPLGNTCQ